MNVDKEILLLNFCLEGFFEMIHKDNDQGYHHPPSEGENVPEAIALTGTTAGDSWPTVHYCVGESLYLVLQCSHSSL